MYYWIVRSVNPEEHTVEAVRMKKILTKIRVPVIFPLPDIGSELLVDESTRTVISIVTLKSLALEDQPTMDAVTPRAGDVFRALPGMGFFGVLQGLKAALGAGDTGIFVNGRLKEIFLRTNRFLVSGNGFSLDLAAPDSPTDLPELRLSLGDIFRFNVKPSSRELIFDVFGIVTVTVKPDRFTVKAVNPYNGTSKFIVNETFKEDNTYDTPEEVIKTFNMFYKAAVNINSVKVSGTEAEINVSKLSLKAAGGAILAASNLLLKGKSSTDIEGTNVKVTVGDGAKPGTFHVNNGTSSYFRMGDKGVGIYGMNYIKLNGTGDYVISYNQMDLFLQQLLLCLQAIMSFGGNPYTLPAMTAQMAAPFAAMQSLKPTLKNSSLHAGYPIGNFMTAE